MINAARKERHFFRRDEMRLQIVLVTQLVPITMVYSCQQKSVLITLFINFVFLSVTGHRWPCGSAPDFISG